MDGTSLTWHRLLATSRALHSGVNAEDMRIPAYGGSLFDPERFLFLTSTDASGVLLLTVSDRVMLHVLRSLQIARVKGQEARRLSFRDIDVEQIGYIYEGLLGYTCIRAEETTLGLLGKEGGGTRGSAIGAERTRRAARQEFRPRRGRYHLAQGAPTIGETSYEERLGEGLPYRGRDG